MKNNEAKMNARGHRIVEGYLFIRFKTLKGSTTAWVRPLKNGAYRECKKIEAERTNTLILLGPGDLIEKKPAVYNLHYDELELAEGD